MKAWNWYYLTGRHTRSDRTFKNIEIEPLMQGFRLVDKEARKYMQVDMTNEEINEFIEQMKRLQDYKNRS